MQKESVLGAVECLVFAATQRGQQWHHIQLLGYTYTCFIVECISKWSVRYICTAHIPWLYTLHGKYVHWRCLLKLVQLGYKYNYMYCMYVYIHVIQELSSKSDDLCDLYTVPAVVIVLSWNRMLLMCLYLHHVDSKAFPSDRLEYMYHALYTVPAVVIVLPWNRMLLMCLYLHHVDSKAFPSDRLEYMYHALCTLNMHFQSTACATILPVVAGTLLCMHCLAWVLSWNWNPSV